MVVRAIIFTVVSLVASCATLREPLLSIFIGLCFKNNELDCVLVCLERYL